MKKKWKTVFVICFCIFIVLQQIAVRYRLERVSKAYVCNLLEEAWQKALIEDVITSKKISDKVALKEALVNLQKAKMGIEECGKRLREKDKKRYLFFKREEARYLQSIEAFRNIILFLIAHEGQYRVEGEAIFFDKESDANCFWQLSEQRSFSHAEK